MFFLSSFEPVFPLFLYDTDDLIIVDPATRATFRPKALMRTKALSFYLSSARPLHFDHYSPTPSKRSHAQVHAQMHAQTQLSSASAAASGESPASAAGGTSAVALAGADAAMLGAEETAKGKKTGSDLVPIKPEKRKYVFKNRPAPSAASVGTLLLTFLYLLVIFLRCSSSVLLIFCCSSCAGRRRRCCRPD